MRKEFKAIVTGRVQMVMYRDFATRQARGLAIFGSVRNLSDGTVEVIAQGDERALQEYAALLKHGPILARVATVEVSWRTPTEIFDRFVLVR